MKRFPAAWCVGVSLVVCFFTLTGCIDDTATYNTEITNVSVTADSVTVTWIECTDVYNYMVKYRPVGSSTGAWSTEEQTEEKYCCTLKNLRSNTSYEVSIDPSSYDESSGIVIKGSTVTAKTAQLTDANTLSIPTAVNAVYDASTGSVDITWDAVADAVRYDIYHSLTKNLQLFASSTTCSVTDGAVQKNQCYTYAVRAYSADGNYSDFSFNVSVSTGK